MTAGTFTITVPLLHTKAGRRLAIKQTLLIAERVLDHPVPLPASPRDCWRRKRHSELVSRWVEPLSERLEREQYRASQRAAALRAAERARLARRALEESGIELVADRALFESEPTCSLAPASPPWMWSWAPCVPFSEMQTVPAFYTAWRRDGRTDGAHS